MTFPSPGLARLARLAQSLGGLACAVVGAALLPRPLTTLLVSTWLLAGALMWGAALLARRHSTGAWRWLGVLAIIALAVAVAVAGSRALALAPPLVSILAAGNAVRLASRAARSGPARARVTDAVWAVGNIAAAIPLWLWPDLTLLLLAWAIAGGLIAVGAILVWRALRPRRPREDRAAPGPRAHPGLRLAGALVVTALAATSATLTIAAQKAVPTSGALLRVGGFAS